MQTAISRQPQIKPLTALVIITIAAVLIYAYLWANDQLLEVGGPNQMRLDRDANLYIHIAGQLFKLEKSSHAVTQIDLSRFGVYDMVGDFDFFSNGDLLIRKGRYQPDMAQGILLYSRVIDKSEPLSHNNDEGLFRCQLSERICSRFGNVDFNSAFHLSIDRDDDSVYVSDTNRSIVRKYNSEGSQLALEKNQFWFPNHNMLWEKQLAVADTNHHAIKFLEIDTRQFGKVAHSFGVAAPEFGAKNWVFSFARVGEHWWVNNMNNQMAYGLIGVFDSNFAFQRMLPLPVDADPNDIAVFDQQVYISDLANNRIYQYDLRGQPMASDLPAAVTDYISILDGKRTNLITLKLIAIVLFVALVVAGFVVAMVQNRG